MTRGVRLSDDWIRAFERPAGSARVAVWDSITQGFGVSIGARRSALVVRVKNKSTGIRKLTTIGVWPEMTVDQGRERALEILGSARRDPKRTSAERIVAIKVYGVRADGSEAMLAHDVIPSDFETYDIDINNVPFGVWVQKLTAAQIAEREHYADRLSRDVAEGRLPF